MRNLTTVIYVHGFTEQGNSKGAETIKKGTAAAGKVNSPPPPKPANSGQNGSFSLFRSVLAPGRREHRDCGLESNVRVPVVQSRGAQHARGGQILGPVHRVPGVQRVPVVQNAFDRFQSGRGDCRVHRQKT